MTSAKRCGHTYNHLVLAGKHNAVQRDGDSWRNDNVVEKIQQEVSVHTAAFHNEEREAYEYGETSVDQRGIKCHRKTQVYRVGNHPFLVLVDGGLEALERKD